MNNGMKVGILGLAVLAIGSAASAAPLGLIKSYPDIYSESIHIGYSSTSKVLTATGDVIQLSRNSSSTIFINSGAFSLNLSLDSSGNATGGTLTVTGTPASYAGFSSTGTLLTGTLQPVNGFGFTNGASDVFEFVFNVTGGDAASIWQSKVGVILNANENLTGFNNTFSSNFSSTSLAGSYLASSDAFAVPEPASFAALGITGVVLLNCRRTKRA